MTLPLPPAELRFMGEDDEKFTAIGDGIAVGRDNTIGAGALIMRSTQDGEVYVPARTQPRRT
jgi:hypothetical protein